MLGHVAWRNGRRWVVLQRWALIRGHKARDDVSLLRVHLLLALQRCRDSLARQAVVWRQSPISATRDSLRLHRVPICAAVTLSLTQPLVPSPFKHPGRVQCPVRSWLARLAVQFKSRLNYRACRCSGNDRAEKRF